MDLAAGADIRCSRPWPLLSSSCKCTQPSIRAIPRLSKYASTMSQTSEIPPNQSALNLHASFPTCPAGTPQSSPSSSPAAPPASASPSPASPSPTTTPSSPPRATRSASRTSSPRSRPAPASRFLALDVDDPARGAALVDDLEAQGVAIDVLVNNAGWSIHGPAESFADEEVRRQMETVFFGPYRLLRAVVPHMRRRRRGMVVNIGSGAGVDGRGEHGRLRRGQSRHGRYLTSSPFANLDTRVC